MSLNDVERKRLSALTRALVKEADRIEQERLMERKRLEELGLERRRDETLRQTIVRARVERLARIEKMAERIVKIYEDERFFDLVDSVSRKEHSLAVYLEYMRSVESKRNRNEKQARIRDDLEKLPDNKLDELEGELRDLEGPDNLQTKP
jgi:hypothetical protein